MHDCTQCNRYGTLQEKLACAQRKVKRMEVFKGYATFEAFIYTNLRLPLTDAIMRGDWEEVARLWEERRWMVE